MDSRRIVIPDDVAELAETVLDAWREGDMDEADLARAISLVVLADRARCARVGAENVVSPYEVRMRERQRRYNRESYRRLTAADPNRTHLKWQKRLATIKSDPEKLERYRAARRAAEQRRREKNPEAEREKARIKAKRKRDRQRAADPEKARERDRIKHQKRMERNPEAMREKYRRQSRRRWARANADKVLAEAKRHVSSTYPKHIYDDMVQILVTKVMSGDVLFADMKAEAKKASTAYWRDRPEYRQTSMDAQRFDDGKATLHDVVTEGLWSNV